MYSEFLLTLRFDAHVAKTISGLKMLTMCQMPRLCCFLVPEIYSIAIFILFVSLKFKSSKPYVASCSGKYKYLLCKLVDRLQSRPYDNTRKNFCLYCNRRMYSTDPCCRRRHLYVFFYGLKMY